ncbi:MAG: hypothetical protein RAK23_01085 [Thermoplasmata archaeon]|nr:hypothetical protein [Thermoplasmata archaeon]
MNMIGERLSIDSTLPSKIPVSTDDLCSISHSDFYHRLKEIIYGKPSKKSILSYGTSIIPGSLIIPLDPILPVVIRKTPINYSELQEKLKSFTNGITISSVDPNSIWALDVLIQKLYEMQKIYIKKKSTYYCDYCKTALTTRDVKFEIGEGRILYCKIKINENTYFVHFGDEETVLNVEGLIINKYDKFIIQDQGNEKWIIHSDTFKKLTEKQLIFPTKIIDMTGNDILDQFKDFSPIIKENQNTRLLSGEVNSNDEKILGENAKKLQFEIIDHENVQKEIPFCKYCGKKARRKRTKEIYLKLDSSIIKFHPEKFEKSLKVKEILISKDFKNFPKIPILECDRCGKIEYGSMEKPCSCGGTMKNNYTYDPDLLPAGIFAMTQSIKNKVFINHKNLKKRFPLFFFFSALKSNYITDVFIRYTELKELKDYDPEVLRLAYILKKNGTLNNNDLLKISKIKNHLKNILNYSLIHNTNQKETMIDQYALSITEKYKKNLMEKIEKPDLYNILCDYYGYIETLSKKYMKLIRGEQINSDLINELISISYPFFPYTILEFINKTTYEINKIEKGKFMINEFLEKIFNDIFEIKRDITNLKRKKDIELSKPINKIIFETEMRFIPLLVNIKKELKEFFNTTNIEITEAWKGLEYKVVLKRDKLGDIYKPLANTIELILQKIDPKKLKDEIEKNGYNVGVEGQLITITSNMVDFILKLPENFEAVQKTNIRAYIDFNSNENVENLHIIKKLKRRISFMKNKLKVDYDDYIRISMSDSQILKAILKPYQENLMKELKIVVINFTDKINEMLVLSFEEILEGNIDIGISPMYKKYKIKALSKLPSLNEDDAEKLFNAGYFTLMEIKSGDLKTISEKSGIPISKLNIVKEYLKNVSSYKIIKTDRKYYCPMCETEIDSAQPFCPKCNSPISWD